MPKGKSNITYVDYIIDFIIRNSLVQNKEKTIMYHDARLIGQIYS